MLETLYATFSILCGDCGTWEVQSVSVQIFNFINNKNEIKRKKSFIKGEKAFYSASQQWFLMHLLPSWIFFYWCVIDIQYPIVLGVHSDSIYIHIIKRSPQ